jgi:glucose-1-phosphate cytidylyltransferase
MKVVLFCGGLGMRMREFSGSVPKPLVPLGTFPILWHVMRYYAHYGHTDFILCLGYKGELIRDFVNGLAGQVSAELTSAVAGMPFAFRDESTAGWRITCVDTGLDACVGERLRAVRSLVASEEMFLANYVDGLADLPLPEVISRFARSKMTACFASVCPQATFHLVEADTDGTVTGIDHIRSGRHRINGGFFVFRQGIFEMVQDGEDLVEMPFQRLLKAGQLMAYRHDGFWACMDTFREKQVLEDFVVSRRAPWMVWQDA